MAQVNPVNVAGVHQGVRDEVIARVVPKGVAKDLRSALATPRSRPHGAGFPDGCAIRSVELLTRRRGGIAPT